MGGKHSRTKGHSYEREIAIKFRKFFPEARRQLEYNENDCNGIDIQDAGQFDIQCKRYRKYAPISCLKEVKVDKHRVPLLITKGDREADVVCLYLTDFLDILEGLHNKENIDELVSKKD